MADNFGVIVEIVDDKAIVLYEGNENELSDMINVIKSDSAKIVKLNKDAYDNCKDNIVELNGLIKSNLS